MQDAVEYYQIDTSQNWLLFIKILLPKLAILDRPSYVPYEIVLNVALRSLA